MKVAEELEDLRRKRLPDPSKEEAAKEYLIVAQEKYDRSGGMTKTEMEDCSRA